MKIILSVIFSVLFLNAYVLEVNSTKSVEKLESIGIHCQKKGSFFVCLENKNINYLKRVKDFLKKEYNITSYIVSLNNTLSANTKHINNEYSSYAKTTGYCIQVLSGKNLSALKKYYFKYKDILPLLRIEKIGNFYTLRSGLGSYKDIKTIYSEIKKGFIRKCDLIPSRIIVKNFDVYNKKNLIVSNTSKYSLKLSNNNLTSNVIKSDLTVKSMYYYLNNGNLIEAKRIAKLLLKKYPEDSLNVLGLVALKQKDFKNACYYFTKLVRLNSNSNYVKLKRNACSVWYLKKGYSLLNNNPKLAYKFFKNSLKEEDSLDAKLGIAYVYINQKYYDKALSLLKKLLKEYPQNKDKIIPLIAQIYSETNNFAALNNLLEENKQIFKNDKELLFNINLKKAQLLIKEKKYDKAEDILFKLYKQNPSNINLLLTLGNLYFKKKDYKKAYSFYNNVLILDPTNYYALRALEGIALINGNYEEAIKYSNKLKSLGYQDELRNKILDNMYLSKAKNALKKGDLDKAFNYLLEINREIPDKYILLGDIALKKGNKVKAYEYYSKAYALSNRNFDVTLKFLYSLLKLNLFDQIKIVLRGIDVDKLTPLQKEKLKEFYKALYLKYASYLLNQKNYKDAIIVAKYGLHYSNNNYKFYPIIGWSCYNLKDYKCAKKYFSLYLKYKRDEKVIYGLALCEIQLGNKKRAKELLDSIKNTSDENLRINIAEAYALIGNINYAKKLINKKMQKNSYDINIKYDNGFIFPSDLLNKNNKDSSVNEVNYSRIYNQNWYKEDKSSSNVYINYSKYEDSKIMSNKEIKLVNNYQNFNTNNSKLLKIEKIIAKKESKRVSNIFTGFYGRNKSGESGKSKLIYLSPFVGFNLYKGNLKFYGEAEYYYLTSGSLDNYDNLGTNQEEIVNNFITSTDGSRLKLGLSLINYNHFFDFMIGRYFFDNKVDISPIYLGHIQYAYTTLNNKFLVKLYRDLLKDSILSFRGNIDPYSDLVWGRVINNGISFEYTHKFDENDSSLILIGNYSYLNGKNVLSNREIDITVFPLFFVGDNFLDEDYLGIYFSMYHYLKDENSFEYPYGGYYSPTLSLIFGPRYEGYLKGKSYIFKLYLYPALLFNGNVNFYFEGGAGIEKCFYDQFAIELASNIRTSADYSEFSLLLQFKYYFSNKKYLFKSDVDSLLKRIFKW